METPVRVSGSSIPKVDVKLIDFAHWLEKQPLSSSSASAVVPTKPDIDEVESGLIEKALIEGFRLGILNLIEMMQRALSNKWN